MPTPAQIAANQANAQKSTGPTSTEGKAAVSVNALKTGLTGHTVLLPTDDAELYAKHVESHRARYAPVGDAETELVQSIADTHWRLARIPSLEAAIYALGRSKLADLHANQPDPHIRATLIEAEVHLAYERQLRNLHIQESRLRRHVEKDLAALKAIQEPRLEERRKELVRAAECYASCIRKDVDFEPVDFGFDFSMTEIELKTLDLYPLIFQDYYDSEEAA